MSAQGIHFVQYHLQICGLLWRVMSQCDLSSTKAAQYFLNLFLFKVKILHETLLQFQDLSQTESFPVRYFCFSSLPSLALGPLPDLFQTPFSSFYRLLLHSSNLSFMLLLPPSYILHICLSIVVIFLLLFNSFIQQYNCENADLSNLYVYMVKSSIQYCT